MRTKQALGALSLLLGALAGCAGAPASPATDSSTTTRPVPTVSRSTGTPDNPTDQLKPIGWVVGTVTSGGSGPCYGLTTDDGTQYALYSTAGTALVKGARVRVRIKPALVRIYCGPGKLVEMTATQPLT